jgi:hypothetical protein
LQQVLDEHISVKDFGAVGDGVTDDTNAINRAIQQTYYNLLNGATVQNLLYKNTQRVIRFPAGTYLITSTILVPPNCTLIGEGKNNTRIYSPLVSAISTCDSFFQTGTNMGTGLTINTGVTQYPIFPSFITVEDMEFQTLQTVPAVYIQAANHVIFNRCQFSGGTYGATIDAVTISAQTTPSSEIKFLDSTFTGYTGNPINITPNSTGIVVRNDHIDTTQVILAVGTNNITTLANGAGRIDYQIQDNDNSYRFGTVKYNVDVGVAVFDDEFTEPATSLGANVHIYPNAAMYCSVPVQSTLKYNIKQFT